MDIRVLDNKTINKIAAGEVIENAASVVKELVENSLDAGAKNIVIEIFGGGLELIKVSDDGLGIDKDYIKLAFTEHATSKLTEIEDLENIATFGFRGEALPSIASVADIVVTTKNCSENEIYGHRCEIVAGVFSDIEEVASNAGTSIMVKRLFANVPVRKKFLKDISKENAYINDLVIKFALSNPNVAFSLSVEGKRRFSSNGNGDIKAILYELYGKHIYDNLVDFDDEYSGIRIKGTLAKPIVARNTRQDEIYFVNKRYIKNKTISNAIENAYEPYLMQHKFPLVVIDLSIDSRLVDVNVHPKKLEVRFSNETGVYFAVSNIVSKTLKNKNLIHEETFDDDTITLDKCNNENSFDNKEVLEEKKESDIRGIDDLPTLSSIFDKKIDAGLSLNVFNDKLLQNDENRKIKDFKEQSFISKTLSEDHKYIGQVFDTYILVEFENKLYIIDQHAAHEKINFENIMSEFKNGSVSSQKVFPSIMLKLTPRQYEAVESNINEFEKLGFEIDTFGDNDIKVDAVPYNIFNIGSEKLLMDMIDSFADDKNKEEYDSIVEKIASISCKKAIKANHKLSEFEVKELLRKLMKLDNPYNCPHGRPTIISLSKTEFEKKFGRIV